MRQDQDRILTANFAYLGLATLAFFTSFVLFFPTLPIYIQAHGGTESLIGLLIGGSSLVSLVLRPFTGRLVESRGRKLLLTLGGVSLLVSAMSYDFVVSLPFLWVARLMAGVGIAFFLTAALAFLADISPARRLGEAMSYWGMAQNLGMALGPPIGIWLISSPSLRSTEGTLERWLPGTGSEVGAGEYNFAILFVVGAAVALLCALLSRKLTEVHRPVRRAREPLGQALRSMFNRAALLPAFLNSLLTVNLVALNAFIPLYGKEIGVGNIGFYYTLYATAMIGVRMVGGRVLDRYPRAYSIIPALGTMTMSTLLLALVQEPWMVFVSAPILGVGVGIAQPGFQALLLDRVRGVNVGPATATFAMGLDIGVLAGGGLMGLVLQLTGFSTMFIVAGMAPALAIAVLAVTTWRSAKARATEAAALAREGVPL